MSAAGDAKKAELAARVAEAVERLNALTLAAERPAPEPKTPGFLAAAGCWAATGCAETRARRDAIPARIHSLKSLFYSLQIRM
jgi:hypothetical protein